MADTSDCLDLASLTFYLRASRRGDAEAFSRLLTPYLDLLAEFFACCGCDRRTRRMDQIAETALAVWRAMPFARRLSDFECLLAARAIQLADQEVRQSLTGPLTPFERLNLTQRFLILAREMESWSFSGLRRICRCRRHLLDQGLSQIRCALIGFDLSGTNANSSTTIRQINRYWDERLPRRSSLKLCHRIRKDPDAHGFKSRWLSFRCDLIDLRQDLRLTDRERHNVLTQLVISVRNSPMEKRGLFSVIQSPFSPLRLRQQISGVSAALF